MDTKRRSIILVLCDVISGEWENRYIFAALSFPIFRGSTAPRTEIGMFSFSIKYCMVSYRRGIYIF